MLRSTKDLMGYRLAATDGPIGKVKDFLFDQDKWTVRWIVVDTGEWLPERKVLISPVSVGEPEWNSQLFPVRLAKEQVEKAPGLDADAPVSREYEKKFFDQYSWQYYWGGAGMWGPAAYPVELFDRREKDTIAKEPPRSGTDVVRSMKEVQGYNIDATDGEIGHVEEFIVDDKSWVLRYMVVDTRNWLPGRKVLVAPDWIDTINWAERNVSIGLTRGAVKGSLEYHPAQPVNREYESKLYDYYGRPVYW